jgi:hypothetical protein
MAVHPDFFAETIMRRCRAELFAALGQLEAAETEVGLCWAAGRSGAVQGVEVAGPQTEARLRAAKGDTAAADDALRRAATGAAGYAATASPAGQPSPGIAGAAPTALFGCGYLAEEQRPSGTATAWRPSFWLAAELGFLGWGPVSGGGPRARSGTRLRFRRSQVWTRVVPRLSECSNLCL